MQDLQHTFIYYVLLLIFLSIAPFTFNIFLIKASYFTESTHFQLFSYSSSENCFVFG